MTSPGREALPSAAAAVPVTMTETNPSNSVGSSSSSNNATRECRMLINVARYYDVISRVVDILDRIGGDDVSSQLLQVIHKPEVRAILICYGEVECIMPDVDERKPEVAEPQELKVEESKPAVAEDFEELSENAIIELQEDEMLIFEEEQAEAEAEAVAAVEREEDEVEEMDVGGFEFTEQSVDTRDESEADLVRCANDEASNMSEYYVEYLEDESVAEPEMILTAEAEESEEEDLKDSEDDQIGWRYKCKFVSCNEKFVFSTYYEKHLRRVHTGTIKPPIELQCKYLKCKHVFDDTFKLHIHHMNHKVKQVPKVVVYCCHICRVEFKSKLELKQHTKAQHPTNPKVSLKIDFKRKCALCEEFLDPKINVYNIHCLEKHGRAPYSCFLCGKVFYLLAHLSEHIKSGHEADTVKESITNSLWRSFSQGETRINECRMCFRLFTSAKAELQHQESHVKELSLTCPNCGGKHYESQCNESRPKFTAVYEKVQCDQCQRWMSKKNIKDHKATHTSERNYPCTVCKKTFKVQRTAHRHIQNHINAQNKLRKCYECDQLYSDEDFLEQHYRQAHPDRRPFNCPICREGFFRKSSLADHSHTHTAEERQNVSVKNPVEHYQLGNARVYECTLCRRSFSAKRTTVAHFIVHTDRPFVCEHCQLSFRVKTALEDHLLDVHKVKL